MSLLYSFTPSQVSKQLGTDLYSEHYEAGSVPTPPTEEELIINPTNDFFAINPTNERIEVHQ